MTDIASYSRDGRKRPSYRLMATNAQGDEALLSIPLYIQSTDPSTGPEAASLVDGAIWIDTSIGPPYRQRIAQFDGDAFDSWAAPQLVNYGTAGQVVQAIVNPDGSLVVYVKGTDAGSTFELLPPGSSGLGGVVGLVWDGSVTLTALPTADPNVAGAIWSNAGVLTVSAGGG